MKKLLVIVDIQNDFVDGALGTKEAAAMIPNVVQKIRKWDGDLVCTMDTHYENYLSTAEGKKLPVPHCIKDSAGWQINSDVREAMKAAGADAKIFIKETFGSLGLARYIAGNGYTHIEFVGLCTDICVISNALLTKAAVPESTIIVDASCCAGVTSESHRNALSAMKMCQIDVINE